MMTHDLAALRKIAERPLRVHWVAAYSRYADDAESAHVVQAEKQHMRVAFPTSDGDPAIMEHIAAFDPPTAIYLLDEIEELRRANIELSRQRDMAALKLAHYESQSIFDAAPEARK